MKPTKQVEARQSIFQRGRAVSLLLVLLCTLFPAAVRAQEAPQTVDAPEATVLDQRETDAPEVTVLDQHDTPDGPNTTLQINVRKDSFLSSRQPDTNFGGDSELRLGWSDSVYQAMRILIEFDIGAIPAHAVINKAELYIFQLGVTPGGDRPMDYRAQFMRSSWSEGGVTWNNANYLGGDALPLGSVDSAIGWKTADVTNLVKTWYSGARPNYGLIVTGDEIPTNNRIREFASREQGSSAPYIVLNFTVVCDTIAPVAGVSPLPTFSPGTYLVSWSGTDTAPPGCKPSGIANYDVEYRINGSSWHQWKNQTQSTSNHFNDWAENGDFVEFHARATDNAGNVQPFGNPQASTRVDTEPPSVIVNPLPVTTVAPFFTLSWSGVDNLSGVANYDVEFRENGGAWQVLLEATTLTFFQVTGAQNGVTYDFRIRATDNVGNGDDWPDTPQASTTVSTFAVATILRFVPDILKPTDPVTNSFVVNWTGTAAVDVPIVSYEIYYQFEGGAWQLWQTFPAEQTSAPFPFPELGLGDGIYGFEALAINSAGQREPQRFVPEAQMLVDADKVQPRAFLPLAFYQLNTLAAEAEMEVATR